MYVLVGLDLVKKELESHSVGEGGTQGCVWQKLALSGVRK